MSHMRLCGLIMLLALMGVLATPRASASPSNQAVKVTFSGPVEVPGTALPAGTYVFKTMLDDPDGHVIQIWTADRTKLLATVLAIPDYRFHSTGNVVIKFEGQRAPGAPDAIRAFFYPGDRYGHEFVYPKSEATELAKRSNVPVLSVPDEQAANMTKPASSVKDNSVAAMKAAPVTAVQPSGQQEATNRVVQSQPSK